MLIYVDDIILTGNDDQSLHSLIKQLSSEFALKDLGDIHYFLGIEVHRHHNGITLSQGNYIKDLLNQSHMINSAHINTPMALKTPSTLPTANNLIDATSYRSIVGALQYVTYTRPDIVQAVNKVCQKLQNPTASDMTSVKHILWYLKGTMHHGLTFINQSSLNLYGFCDADWAGCSNTRRSISGFCIFLGANCISWSSKK